MKAEGWKRTSAGREHLNSGSPETECACHIFGAVSYSRSARARGVLVGRDAGASQLFRFRSSASHFGDRTRRRARPRGRAVIGRSDKLVVNLYFTIHYECNECQNLRALHQAYEDPACCVVVVRLYDSVESLESLHATPPRVSVEPLR